MSRSIYNPYIYTLISGFYGLVQITIQETNFYVEVFFCLDIIKKQELFLHSDSYRSILIYFVLFATILLICAALGNALIICKLANSKRDVVSILFSLSGNQIDVMIAKCQEFLMYAKGNTDNQQDNLEDMDEEKELRTEKLQSNLVGIFWIFHL